MSELTKNDALNAIAIVILLFTAMINWNVYSWLVLVAIILLLLAWYFKGGESQAGEKRRKVQKK